MKVISSQRYLNDCIVDEKIEELEANGATSVTLSIIDAEIKDLNGEDCYILYNGHHTKAAAEFLDLEIKYEETENIYEATGDELLNLAYMDSDWYYVDTECTVW